VVNPYVGTAELWDGNKLAVHQVDAPSLPYLETGQPVNVREEEYRVSYISDLIDKAELVGYLKSRDADFYLITCDRTWQYNIVVELTAKKLPNETVQEDPEVVAVTFSNDLGILTGSSNAIQPEVVSTQNDTMVEDQSFVSPNGEKEIFQRGDEVWGRMKNDPTNEWYTGINGYATDWNAQWVITFTAPDGTTHQSDQYHTFDHPLT
jgi:hypothetical protein